MHFGGGGAEEFNVAGSDGFFVAFQRGFGVGVVFKHDKGVASGASVAHTHEQNAIFPVQYLRRRVALREKLVLNGSARD